MKTKFFIIACLLTIMLLTACSSIQKLDKNANGETITLSTGEQIQIKLEGNITTGYSWQVMSLEETILAPNGEPEYQSESNLAGAGGEFTFTFTAKSPGETHLELGYLRPWEDEAPLETFKITVVVK